MNPKVSVIIPNYNHAKYLIERLDSVFKQTFQDFEVILLDDCSQDTSWEILQSYENNPKVKYCIRNEQNSGSPFKQWKKGLNLAKGELIWIAESDDSCESTFLERNLQLLADNNNAGVAYCQSIDINQSGEVLSNRIQYTDKFKPNIWKSNFIKEGSFFIDKYMSCYNVIPNASAVIFKKELAIDDVFCDSLLKMKMCGDWFFWIKLLLKTQIVFLECPLNYFRIHPGVSRNHFDLVKKRQRLVEESEIRSFLQKVGFYNKEYVNLLYYQWFKLFHIKSVFSYSFYKVKLQETTFFDFCFIFFQKKIHDKKDFFLKRNISSMKYILSKFLTLIKRNKR